jgi:alkanesulfonate monooxygenase SsuD/methylene tetrahydromethanopterin reductase-like flavin-dependent oxidoreductase (luciferase family)
MGQTDQPAHDARYDHADEYLEVLYKLWEGSWEDNAVLRHRERGVFTDPDKVHHIGHEGEHFSVPGVHLVEPSIRRTPVIYQAGSSPRGVRFAAENAEAIFTAAPTKAILRDTVSRIRQELELAGRDPYAAKIFNLTTIITAETDEAAHAKHAEYLSYGDPEGALVFMSGWMGVNLARYGLDEPVGNVDSNATLCAWRIRCRSGSRKPTSTVSTWRMRSRPARRRFHRARCSHPHRGRCLPIGLCPRQPPQQVARPRRPAARRAPRCVLPGGRPRLHDHRAAIDGAVLVGVGRDTAGQGTLNLSVVLRACVLRLSG